ncbi:MAG: nuclear transport factor 2 family protein, partial [Ilumatobacteraceae bacterium]|nr:nuclear transport factor 2 family protein [Ilumatobacteraceae bacterium]
RQPGSGRAMTGHISTNMQIELDGDEATTLAYFFEIVDDSLVLIGAYQHPLRRQPDRWRFAFLRIAVRYRARLETRSVSGQPLAGIVDRDVGNAPGIAHPGPT